MKKIYIALIAVIAVLLVALLACGGLGSKQNIESFDSDSAYAYGYTVEKSGLKITIKGEFPEGSQWTGKASGTAAVVSPEGKPKAKEVRFMIEPVSFGSDTAVFTLMGGETGSDFLYEITADLVVNYDKSIKVVKNSHRSPAEGSSETIGETAMNIVSAADGSLKVTLKDGDAPYWNVISDTDCVNAYWESEDFDNDEKVLSIEYVKLGQGPVTVYHTLTGEGVKMLVMTDLLGNVQLDRYEVITYPIGGDSPEAGE